MFFIWRILARSAGRGTLPYLRIPRGEKTVGITRSQREEKELTLIARLGGHWEGNAGSLMTGGYSKGGNYPCFWGFSKTGNQTTKGIRESTKGLLGYKNGAWKIMT